MQESLPVILAVPGAYRQKAAALGLPLAHMTYALRGANLYRTGPAAGQGGVMAVDCAGGYTGTPAGLAAQAGRECTACGYTGIFLDREAPPDASLRAGCAALERMCRTRGLHLYVSPALAACAPAAAVLVSTAVTSGTLQRRLLDAETRYGRGHVALDLEVLRADITPGKPDGRGKPLSAAALDALIRSRKPKIFFSDDLCTHYFTYRADGQTHFVLFDDAQSLRRKLETGARLHARCAFVFYPEAAAVLPQLLT